MSVSPPCALRIVGNFQGRKFLQIAHFCHAQGRHTPKFYGENFRKYPQNRKIHESFLPRKFSPCA